MFCATQKMGGQAAQTLVLTAVMAVCFSGQALGQTRMFPEQAQYCKISSHRLPDEPTATVNGQEANLPAGLVIRDESNRVVVKNRLPQSFEGMCIMGQGGALEKVWIMNEEQSKMAQQSMQVRARQKAMP